MATFRNCKGQSWNVGMEVDESNGKKYFYGGWKGFIEENSIKENDFLVFSHVWSFVFDVKVLELDGCEKSVPDVSEESGNVLVEDDTNLIEEEEEEEEDRTTHMEVEDEELHPEYYVKDYNPYFVANTWNRRNELYIPFRTIKDYDLNLEHNEKIILHGPDKREKMEKIIKWKDNRTCITGWGSFCRRNHVDQRRDACICEFMVGKEREDEEGQKMKFLQVHVIRKHI